MKNFMKIVLLFLLTSCAVAQTRVKMEAAAVSGARSLRDVVTDKDSFRVSSAKAIPENEDGKVRLCFNGRVKNKQGGYSDLTAMAFGLTTGPDAGKAIPVALASGSGDSFTLDETGTHIRADVDALTIAKVIAQFCDGHTGVDMTDAVKAALKQDREKE